MNGITDHPFRHIQKKYGRPMLVYTEFASVEAVLTGDRRLFKDFLYDESQRPIIAQIYGRRPESFRHAAILLCQLGFDGIDINMGCPTKSVAMSGAGAGLIRTPRLAQEIISATRAGVQDWLNGATLRDCAGVPEHMIVQAEAFHALLPLAYQQRRPIPVSVKTRIGYEEPEVEEWIPALLEMDPVAIGIHGRTLVQGYAGHADWDEIGKAVALADGTPTLILGNGDIQSLEDAHQRIADTGVDGVLIGRASYGNPFVFQPQSALDSLGKPTATALFTSRSNMPSSMKPASATWNAITFRPCASTWAGTSTKFPAAGDCATTWPAVPAWTRPRPSLSNTSPTERAGKGDNMTNSKSPRSVAVIGGGPAGLMAAEVLAQGGVGVDLYDAKPSVGRKFLVAGKGGLNLTHAEPYDQFLTRYGPRRDKIAAAARCLRSRSSCASGRATSASTPSWAHPAASSRSTCRPRRCCAPGCTGCANRASVFTCVTDGRAGMKTAICASRRRRAAQAWPPMP